MRVEINCSRIDLTDALKKYAETKIKSVERLVKRFELQGELIAFVEISKISRHHKQGDVYYAEITMKMPEKTIRIEKTHESIQGAIDQLKDTLKEEVARTKELGSQKKKK